MPDTSHPAKSKQESGGLTHESVSKALHEHHAAMADAVHTVLRNAGVHGLTVHSITFSMPADFVGNCNPPCPDGMSCKPVSTGHGTTFRCV